MATQEILLQYKADITDLQAKVTTIENQFKKVSAASEKSGAATKQATEKISSGIKGLSDAIAPIGGLIAGAFAADRIINFGIESVKAFQAAELNAKKLQTAVSVNGGLSEDYQALIEQSKQLQEITIFSDDDIQQAQTMALQFGLTSDQVKALIPVVTDFASATGQGLQQALESVLQGVNGMGRGLKLYGVEIDKSLTKQEQLGNITDQLTKKFEGQAEVIGKTSSGQLKRLENQFDDTKESIGEFILSIGEGGAAIINWIANGFKPLDDELDKTTSSLKGTTAEIQRIKAAIDQATLGTLQVQFDNLSASADAPQEALKRLAETIRGIKTDSFKAELEKLDDNQLKDTLEKITEVAKKTTIELTKQTDLTNSDKIKILQQELAAREANNKLLAEQNKIEDSNSNKEAEDAAKRIKEQQEAQEALRKFTLKTFQDNIDAQALIDAQHANDTIKNEQDLQAELNRIDLKALEDKRSILVQFAEDTLDIDKQILDKKISNNKQDLQAQKDAGNQTLKQIQENEKNRIALLETVKDDPKTKIDEEAQAQQEIFKIRKGSVNQQALVLEELRKLGILNEEEYTEAVKQLTQDRKKIKADEDAFRLKQDGKTRDELIENIKKVQEAYDTLSSTVSQAFSAIFESQLNSLQAQSDANKQYFDDQQTAIEDQVKRRLITEGQGEKKSADLKKQRAASEKKSQEEINAIKRKQAEADKLLSLFKIGLELAEAIAELNAVKIAAAGAQLAIVAATPIPKFAKGTEYVKRGSNPAGIDTIPALLNEGERVVTAENNKKHWDLYQAIEMGKLNQYVHKVFITPILKQGQREYSKSKERDFATNITNSLAFNGLTAHEADRIRRKGTHINNAEEIAELISKRIAQDIHRASLYNR